MDVDSICKKPPKRMQPRIAALVGEEDTAYMIVCEQRLLMNVSSLKLAVFFLVAAYYCFNLEYPTPLKNVYFFSKTISLVSQTQTEKQHLILQLFLTSSVIFLLNICIPFIFQLFMFFCVWFLHVIL